MAAASLGEICRLCMSRDDVMSPIYKTENFAMRVMSVAQVKICVNDGLPTHICRRCFLRVDAAYDFQEVCWTSDLSLKKKFVYMNPDSPDIQQVAEVTIKQEVNNDTSYTTRGNLNHPMQMEFVSTGTGIADDINSTADDINSTALQPQDSDLVSNHSSQEPSHCPLDTSAQSDSDQDSDADTPETSYLCPKCRKPALPRRTLTPRSTRRAKRRLVYECTQCKKPYRRSQLVKCGAEVVVANTGKKRKLADSVVEVDLEEAGGGGKVDVAVQTTRVRPGPGSYLHEKEDCEVDANCFCGELKAMVNPESIGLIEKLVAVLKQVMNKKCPPSNYIEPCPNALETNSKRKRGENFNSKETLVLAEEVMSRLDIISGDLSETLSKSDKDLAWDYVACKVNAVSHTNRSIKELKLKWKGLKAKTKKKASINFTENVREAGEEPSQFKHMTPLEELILCKVIGQECIQEISVVDTSSCST